MIIDFLNIHYEISHFFESIKDLSINLDYKIIRNVLASDPASDFTKYDAIRRILTKMNLADFTFSDFPDKKTKITSFDDIFEALDQDEYKSFCWQKVIDLLFKIKEFLSTLKSLEITSNQNNSENFIKIIEKLGQINSFHENKIPDNVAINIFKNLDLSFDKDDANNDKDVKKNEFLLGRLPVNHLTATFITYLSNNPGKQKAFIKLVDFDTCSSTPTSTSSSSSTMSSASINSIVLSKYLTHQQVLTIFKKVIKTNLNHQNIQMKNLLNILNLCSNIVQRVSEIESQANRNKNNFSIRTKESIKNYQPIMINSLVVCLKRYEKLIKTDGKDDGDQNHMVFQKSFIKFSSLLSSKFKKSFDRVITPIIVELLKFRDMREAVINLLSISNEQQIRLMKVQVEGEMRVELIGCLDLYNKRFKNY